MKGRDGEMKEIKEGREKEDLRKSRSLTLLEEIGSDEEPHFCRSSREEEKGIKGREVGLLLRFERHLFALGKRVMVSLTMP